MADDETRQQADGLREQYEALPYPERNPADEAKRLVTGSPSSLWELNHYVFGGARDWSKPFRALVAGGGTGDAAIMLAQQLTSANIDASVCHLDLSTTSQTVARARADARGLTNIEFVQGSLLDPATQIGPFDYIDCCGVLHHLEDPAGGLAALAARLAPGGGIGLMVYGELGRIGVYHVQEALHALAPREQSVAARIQAAKKLIAGLPATNWLVRNPFISDHLDGGDAGIYDLLLHSRDRAYRVGELADLVEGANLRIVSFIEPARYRPERYIDDPKFRRLFEDLEPLDGAALAEVLAGNMNVHICYAVATDNPVSPPDPTRPDAVPILRDMTPAEAVETIPAGGAFVTRHGGLEIKFSMPPLAKAIVERCDGMTPLAEIHESIGAVRSDLDWEGFVRQFDRLYAALNGINRMVLRVPPD